MKKLNQREKEIASVAADLFLKGSPEWRIAEYAHYRNLTREQFSNFLEKISVLSESVRLVILTHYVDIQRGNCYDKGKTNGRILQHWIDTVVKKKPFDTA